MIEDIQPNQPCLQTVLQKYPLLLLRPVDVLEQNSHLRLGAIGYGREVVEEGAD